MGRAQPQQIEDAFSEIRLDEHRHLTVQGELGRGAFGTVYRATLHQPWGLERPVAMKVFTRLAAGEEEMAVTALALACRSWGSVRHPNVVGLHEFGVLTGKQAFALEELLEGCSLASLLESYARRSMRMPLDLALFLGVELAEGLDGARCARNAEGRRVGLIHGALSAREVLLSSRGEVKISDFGVAMAARAMGASSSLLTTSARVETLAPEVVQGEAPTARSDVFSLGVVLWQMLAGPRYPAHLGEAERLEYARKGLVRASVFDPVLTQDLKETVLRAVEADPERRFPNAGALAYQLRRLALSMGVGDGRVFLKHAMINAFSPDPSEEAATREMVVPLDISSRFELEPPADSGERVSGTLPLGSWGKAEAALPGDEGDRVSEVLVETAKG